MFRSLLDLAEREGLLADPSFEPKPVDFLIHLGTGGEFLHLVECSREAQARDAKGRPRGVAKPPVRLIPRRSDRTSEDARPEFLVDKAEYVFGIEPAPGKKRESKKLEIRRKSFKDLIDQALVDLPENKGLMAVSSFLSSATPHQVTDLLKGTVTSTLKPQELAGALFAFVYDPGDPTRCVHDDPQIKTWFRGRLENTEGKRRGQCLVTGENDVVLTRLHAKPKGIPPGSVTKGGVPLTTVNQKSFQSYGLDDLGGAPVSERANLGIETALARLLADNYPGPDGAPLPSRNIPLSRDSILVYWSIRDAPLDFFASLETHDPDAVGRMVRSISGSNPAPVDDPTAFYALILSGKQGRAIVRSLIETTVREVARNIERYRDQARIVRPYGAEPGGFDLATIRKALAPRGDSDRLPPAFGTSLYLSITLGRPFQGAVLETIVRRNRSELLQFRHGQPDVGLLAARTSLLKAWFQRNRGKEVPVALEPSRTEISYRLGRLLATLDKIQSEALGSLNATIVDRYFGSASSTPAAVFPTLIRRSQHHLGTLRRDKPGLGVVRERLLQEILGALRFFPKTLGLEDQGLFSLGFYHQRQDFFTKKEGE